MLPIHAQLARRATESRALSALPAAPVEALADAAPAAAARGMVATGLTALADSVARGDHYHAFSAGRQ